MNERPDIRAASCPALHIYLSPHLDDGPLSCGGRIAAQIAAGDRVRVVNVFAGTPDYARLSAFAARLHHSWGAPTDPVRVRREEDGSVMRRLGAVPEYWEYCDCVYRSHQDVFLYPTPAEVYGPIHQAEQSLITDLRVRFERLALSDSLTMLYVPLGVGGHVDHLIVRTAALLLPRTCSTIVLYEDFPYAAEPGAVRAAREALGYRLVSERVTIDAEAKGQLVEEYRTQLRTLVGDGASLRSKVCTYAAALGRGEGSFERYWRVERIDR